MTRVFFLSLLSHNFDNQFDDLFLVVSLPKSYALKASKLQENNERKNTLVTQVVLLSDAFISRPELKSLFSSDILVRNYLFLKKAVISEGAISHA